VAVEEAVMERMRFLSGIGIRMKHPVGKVFQSDRGPSVNDPVFPVFPARCSRKRVSTAMVGSGRREGKSAGRSRAGG